MSVPEQPAEAGKPDEQASSDEEVSSPAPAAQQADGDAAEQSQMDDEPATESHQTSTADTEDSHQSSAADTNDDPPEAESQEPSTPTLEASATSSPEERCCGILTRSKIEDLKIIRDADADCFKPASYDLRLGRECVHVRGGDGGRRELAEHEPVSLEPFDRLYFETREVVKLPVYVAGRFDLRMHFAIQGLFVQVGTQVDPGYEGKLFGLIINTSSDPVDVFADKRLLTIEFHYLSGSVPRANIPDPCYSLTAFLQSRSIGASKYTKASAIGAIDHRVDDLSKELKDLTQKLQKELEEIHKGWKAAKVFTGIFITFLVLFVTVVISLLVWLVAPAVRHWVAEEARSQLLFEDPTGHEAGGHAGTAGGGKMPVPAEGDGKTPVPPAAGGKTPAGLLGASEIKEEADRTEGQRP